MNSTTVNATATQAQPSAVKFFDFITHGTGLVTRARYVSGRGRTKTPALYCTIAVPLDERGTANGRWTNFDVRVLGQDNINLIKDMMPAVTDGKRPRVHFSIGDAYADPYFKMSGDVRQARAQFKGRLLRVSEAKTDPQRPLLSFGLAYVNGLDHARSSMELGVIHGSVDELQKTYVMATVPDTPEVAPVLDAVIAAQPSQAKVLASVVLRDLQCSAFVYNDASQTPGELGSNVHAHLESVRWLRVEGELVYKREVQQDAASQEPTGSDEPDAASNNIADDEVDNPWIDHLAQAYPDLNDN